MIEFFFLKLFINYNNIVGIGSYHFIVSLVPPSIKWLIEALGFQGNREFALKSLIECSSVSSPKSIYILQ